MQSTDFLVKRPSIVGAVLLVGIATQATASCTTETCEERNMGIRSIMEDEVRSTDVPIHLVEYQSNCGDSTEDPELVYALDDNITWSEIGAMLMDSGWHRTPDQTNMYYIKRSGLSIVADSSEDMTEFVVSGATL